VNAPNISDKAFAALSKRFLSGSGISLTTDKKALVEARLRSRLVAMGHASFEAYCDFLERQDDGSEHQTLIDLLTTNETYFFREPRHFTRLAQEASKRFAHSPMRVWSAACSSGEEPYSLAMLLLDQRPLQPWEIHASDISSRALERARCGVFPLQRLEHMPAGYLERFCLRGHGRYQGRLRVNEEVRSRVQFFQHNLLGPARPSGRFEVIFLRNVLIYFDQASKLRLLSNVLSVLAPGGLLFVGHAEPLHGLTLPLDRVSDALFEKRG